MRKKIIGNKDNSQFDENENKNDLFELVNYGLSRLRGAVQEVTFRTVFFLLTQLTFFSSGILNV